MRMERAAAGVLQLLFRLLLFRYGWLILNHADKSWRTKLLAVLPSARP